MARPDAGIIRLEVGEPDLPIEPHIVAAAQEAAALGVGYTQSFGIAPLREAIVDRLRRVAGLTYAADEIVIGQGGVQAMSVTFAALLDAGDEVLLPDPAWPNYAMTAMLRGAVAVPYALPASNGFLPDVDQLRDLITERTRLIVINSPANPTGAVFPAELVASIVELAAEHDLWVLSDEVYDELVFEGAMANAAQYDRERVVGIYSFSKTYSMTGWRVGYAACPLPLAQLLGTIQEPMVSCISGVSQYAALAALQGPQDECRPQARVYRARRDLVGELLRDGGFEAVRPAGAFYQMVPLGAGHRQPAGRPRSRRARRRHRSGIGVRRGRQPISCGCRSPPRRGHCAVASNASSPGRSRRRPGRRSPPRRP